MRLLFVIMLDYPFLIVIKPVSLHSGEVCDSPQGKHSLTRSGTETYILWVSVSFQLHLGMGLASQALVMKVSIAVSSQA